MARTFRNFEGDALGVGLPTGLTNLYAGNTLGTYEVVADGTSLDGTKVLKFTQPLDGTANRNMITLDTLNGTTDLDIVVRMKFDSFPAATQSEIWWRATGTGGAKNGYVVVIDDGQLVMYRNVSNSFTLLQSEAPAPTFLTNTWYYFRVRSVGNVHKVKFWQQGHPETRDWHLNVTDANIPTAGGIGIGATSIVTGADSVRHIDVVSFATTPAYAIPRQTFPEDGYLLIETNEDIVRYISPDGLESYGFADVAGGLVQQVNTHKTQKHFLLNNGQDADDDIVQLDSIGENKTSIFTGIGASQAVCVNHEDGYIFYNDGANIRRRDYGTWANLITPSTLASAPNQLEYDAENNKIYAATGSNISVMDADGTNLTVLTASVIQGLALSPTHVFGLKIGSGLTKYAKTGGAETVITADTNIVLVAYNSKTDRILMYLSNDSIVEVDQNGGNRSVLNTNFAVLGSLSPTGFNYFDFAAAGGGGAGMGGCLKLSLGI